MKKVIALYIVSLAVFLSEPKDARCEMGGSMSINGFVNSYYGNTSSSAIMKKTDGIPFKVSDKFANMGGDEFVVDTPMELAMLDHATKQRIAIRDVNDIVPKGKKGAVALLAKYKVSLVNGESGLTEAEYNNAMRVYTQQCEITKNDVKSGLLREFVTVGRKYGFASSDLKPVADYYESPANAAVKKIAEAADNSKKQDHIIWL